MLFLRTNLAKDGFLLKKNSIISLKRIGKKEQTELYISDKESNQIKNKLNKRIVHNINTQYTQYISIKALASIHFIQVDNRSCSQRSI